jgi:uncharacterized membrane protein YgdD (TMEM256/DUF423 family)
MKSRTVVLLSALFGASGVMLGAFGAHALKLILIQNGMNEVWDTAVRYQLIHALALLALTSLYSNSSWAVFRHKLSWVARLWTIGIILFSASLYLLALGGPLWLGPITPLGGVSLIAGWLLLGLVALRSNHE